MPPRATSTLNHNYAYKRVACTSPIKGMYRQCYSHGEETANRKYFQAAAKTALFVAFFFFTKRVYILFLCQLFICFIFLQLILYTLRYFLFISSYRIYIISLHQKCLLPYLYFKLANLSNIIKLLLPLKYLICDTLYFGGI